MLHFEKGEIIKVDPIGKDSDVVVHDSPFPAGNPSNVLSSVVSPCISHDKCEKLHPVADGSNYLPTCPLCRKVLPSGVCRI